MNKFVVSTANEVRDLVFKKIKEREAYDPRHTWLLYGRVISLLFAWHFKLAYQAAEEILEKKEKEI